GALAGVLGRGEGDGLGCGLGAGGVPLHLQGPGGQAGPGRAAAGGEPLGQQLLPLPGDGLPPRPRPHLGRPTSWAGDPASPAPGHVAWRWGEVCRPPPWATPGRGGPRGGGGRGWGRGSPTPAVGPPREPRRAQKPFLSSTPRQSTAAPRVFRLSMTRAQRP